MHVIANDVNSECECRTFLYNALHSRHKVNLGKKHADFLVDEKLNFSFKSESETKKTKPQIIYAVDKMKTGHKNEIPIWLLGFLY
jgi:hypothetical protein